MAIEVKGLGTEAITEASGIKFTTTIPPSVRYFSKEVLFNIEERLSQVPGQVRRGIDALGDENQPEERVQVSVNGTSNNQ